MKEIKSTLAKTEKTVLCLTIGGLILAVACRKYFFAWGLAIGAMLGIINFRLLVKNAISFTSKNKKGPYGYFLFSYLGRLLLMGIIFSICIIKEFELFFGAAAGFLFVQASIFLNNFLLYRK